jgi:hypothetical protein
MTHLPHLRVSLRARNAAKGRRTEVADARTVHASLQAGLHHLL